MKRIFICAIFAFAFLLNKANAQISLSVNIDLQPSWGPTGYNHVDYYYIPDIQCYYYVPSHQFVYQKGNRWVFASELPSRYKNFDLFHSYKVVMNEPQPYLHYNDDKVKYDHFKGAPNGQAFIRDSKEEHYQTHWHDQHEADEEQRHHDNGHDNGHH